MIFFNLFTIPFFGTPAMTLLAVGLDGCGRRRGAVVRLASGMGKSIGHVT